MALLAYLDVFAETPSVLHRLFMGRTKGLKGDGAGMDIRVFPPKARDSRFERSMGDTLRQQNEKLEMQEVFDLRTSIVATKFVSLGDIFPAQNIL